jgi:hypothetical protein
MWPHTSLKSVISGRRSVSVLVGFSLALLGSIWAVSSPVGSSPDDDFHLASIWCAWGESDTCLREQPPGLDLPSAAYYVPRQLDFQCYVETAPQSARCLADQSAGWIPGRVDGLGIGGNYPPGFHAAMRVFVGQEIDTSVIFMRIFNSVLAGALLV